MSNRAAIRAAVSMETALELLDMLPPDSAGKILCPLHEEVTPSCHVYEDSFHCFGCGANGDVVWFVAQVTGSPLWRAEKFLAGAVDEDDLKAAVRTRQPKEVLDLWERMPRIDGVGPMLREIASDMIARRWPTLSLKVVEMFGWRVGVDGLYIPHHFDAKVVGIKVRRWNGAKTAVPGSTFTLAPYLAPTRPLPKPARAVLCEGEPDTVALRLILHRKNYLAVGLPSGASAYPAAVHDWLSQNASSVTLCLDADDAGRAATDKIRGALQADGVPVKDLSAQMADYGTDVCDALAAGWVPQV